MPFHAVLAQADLPRCPVSQSSYVCPMSVLPVAGEEAFLTGDVDSSLGSAVGSTVSDEL